MMELKYAVWDHLAACGTSCQLEIRLNRANLAKVEYAGKKRSKVLFYVIILQNSLQLQKSVFTLWILLLLSHLFFHRGLWRNVCYCLIFPVFSH